MKPRMVARTAVAAAGLAVVILALFFTSFSPAGVTHPDALLWALNLFTTRPGDASWVLGNLVYRTGWGLIFSAALGVLAGVVIGRWANAAAALFLALVPAIVLFSWLVSDAWWDLYSLVLVMAIAPLVARWSSVGRE